MKMYVHLDSITVQLLTEMVYQGRTNNLASNAIGSFCMSYFYKGENALVRAFPNMFADAVPEGAVTLVATAVCNPGLYGGLRSLITSLLVLLMSISMASTSRGNLQLSYINQSTTASSNSIVMSRMTTMTRRSVGPFERNGHGLWGMISIYFIFILIYSLMLYAVS